MKLKVIRAPNEILALTNCLLVHPDEFAAGTEYVSVGGACPFKLKRDTLVARGTAGISNLHRGWLSVSLNQEIDVFEIAATPSPLGVVVLEVSFQKKSTETMIHFETEKLSDVFKTLFSGCVFSMGQPVVFDFSGFTFVAKPIEGKDGVFGTVSEDTDVFFVNAPDSKIKLKAKEGQTQRLFIKSDMKLEDLEIGGLDEEFFQIFRRAFASRILPADVQEKLGVEQVRGMMLYGPPGTGKTLIARQLGKMLNSREPKIVNGPEILNKYVGQSEENIRALFRDAEVEQAERGRDSQLHIIIFDEIDAVCKRRGMRGDTTGTSDTVVNQLLSKMDGVSQLSNILVIGMTNRLDLIDEALLRPGRFEISIEIGLPDEAGRRDIFKIHTAKMRRNGMLCADVDLEELAGLAKNFSGAEIRGLITDAVSYAVGRHVKLGTLATLADDVSEVSVCRDDFLGALKEVRPALGSSDEDLAAHIPGGIVHYNQDVGRILREGALFTEQAKNGRTTQPVSVVLHGPVGCGKTAMACKIVLDGMFPFVRVISPATMVGFPESEKVAHIHRVFADAHKSSLSAIVIDDIERAIEFVPIGPRFSNAVLQTITVLLKIPPPKGRRLFTVTTTSSLRLLGELGVRSSFCGEIKMRNIEDSESLSHVLDATGMFSEEDAVSVLLRLSARQVSVGIKRLLSAIETAAQEKENSIDPFVALVCEGSFD
ncbi:MAG: vesicular-fusion protein SEC18 [Amphiamblys sp. WSBS2006]|nr:MAG: vesicular-fusion protein SEC18 [Amphiamblys sp. WSBS2006]